MKAFESNSAAQDEKPRGGNGPNIDNVLSRIIANLANGISSLGPVRIDGDRLAQALGGGSGSNGGPAFVLVAPLLLGSTMSPTAGGGSGGISGNAETGLGTVARLIFSAEASMSLMQFGGGLRTAAVDLRPFMPGGVGVIPLFVLGGGGGGTAETKTPAPNALLGAPLQGAAPSSADHAEPVPRPVEDLPLKKFRLGLEPPPEPAPEEAPQPEAMNSNEADEAVDVAAVDALFSALFDDPE
jgi:hypothetical protein